MKKLLTALTVLMMAVPALAGDLITSLDYNASGSTSATVNCSVGASAGDTPGQQIFVYGIYGGTDKDSAALTIAKGDETGVTTSYTVVDWHPVATTTNRALSQENDGVPVFIGDLNYSYQFKLDSTAKNALRIVWKKQ
jgi:hypothetical protein